MVVAISICVLCIVSSIALSPGSKAGALFSEGSSALSPFLLRVRLLFFGVAPAESEALSTASTLRKEEEVVTRRLAGES